MKTRVNTSGLAAGLLAAAFLFGISGNVGAQVAEELALTAPAAEDMPDELAAILLVEYKFAAGVDGMMTDTEHMVVKPFKPQRAVKYGQVIMKYNERFHDATVDFVQTVLPSGEIGGLDEQGVSYGAVPHVRGRGALQYLKQLAVIIPGMGAGAVMESQLTRSDRVAVYDGKISGKAILQKADPVLEAHFELKVPRGTEVSFRYHELSDRVNVETVGGNDIYRLTARNLPTLLNERFRPSDDEVAAAVFFSTFRSWGEVAGWFEKQFSSVLVSEPEIATMVRDVVSHGQHSHGALGLLYQYVCEKLEYLPSLDRWEQGFTFEKPTDILRSGSGDSFHHATVFMAMLREAGIRAYPVLLNIGGAIDTLAVCPQQFNHCLVAVERENGELVYLNTSSRGSDFGVLPGPVQGRQALLLRPGRPEWTVLPFDPPDKSTETIRADFVLSEKGDLAGTMSVTATGNTAKGWRDFFWTVGKAGRKAALQGRLPLAVSGGQLREIEMGEYRSLFEPVKFSLGAESKRYAIDYGDTLLFTIPPCFTVLIPNALGDIFYPERRTFPLDFGVMIPAFTIRKTVSIQIPRGYVLGVPKEPADIKNRFGELKVSYEFDPERDLVTCNALLRVQALRVKGEDYPELRQLVIRYIEELQKELICFPASG